MNTTQKTQKCLSALASLGLGVSLILASAGCAGSAPPSTAAAEESDPTPTPIDSTAAQRTRDARDVLTLGESASTPRQSRLTVFGFQPIERTVQAPAGTSWQAADIEFCVGPNVRETVPIERIRDEFGLQTETEQFQRPDRGFSAPTEIYAQPGRTVVADECVRGPVIFAVPTDDPAEYVGLFIRGGIIRWAVAGRTDAARELAAAKLDAVLRKQARELSELTD